MKNNNKNNGKLEKAREYLKSLEEEQEVFGIGIKKRYIFFTVLIVGAYILFQISNVIFKPGMAKLETQEKAYRELLEESKKNATQSFSEKNTVTPEERYKQAVEQAKKLSNEEIRELLKEQGVENITDAEIEQTRKNLENSIPKSQAELDEKIREVEEAMRNMEQGKNVPQPNGATK